MNAIAPRASVPAIHMPVLTPQTFDQLMKFAEMAAGSDLVPRDYRGKPANVVIAVQMGGELGLQPMQALNSIAVINGRPGVWGDGLIGLCRQSPLCEDIREWLEGEGDALTAFCEAKRHGSSPVVNSFSVADAKKAGLWGKQGPWQQYPSRMLKNRARGFSLRDAFPDLLRGLKTVEELQDIPREERYTQATDVTPQRSAPRPAPSLPKPPTISETLNGDDIPTFDAPPPPKPKQTPEAWLQPILDGLAAVTDQDAFNEIMMTPKMRPALQAIERDHPALYAKYEDARAAAMERIVPRHVPEYYEDQQEGGEVAE